MALTRPTFSFDRYHEDGQIEFMGRVDTQVKIRGLRIELGEIEAALAASEHVRDCVVIVREDVPGQKKIVAYVVSNISNAQNTLRSLLKKSLPDYMIPTCWMFMNELPLTANGKVSRRELPQPTSESESRMREYVAPSKHSEIIIAEIMSDILGLPKVGVHDNFFDLGGHSLTATLLLSRIYERLRTDISVHDLFNHPTVAGIATVYEKINTNETNNDDEVISPIAPFDPKKEIQLPQEIFGDNPGNEENVANSDSTFDFSQVSKSKHILLTGATGFLGAFVLAELLKSTEATIHCLIRVNDTILQTGEEPSQRARSKLRANLEKYKLFPSKSFMRIYPVVVGDLEKEKLGLGQHAFQELAQSIDAIYHCGAYVHSLYPYAKLRNANVKGTIELLRLATTSTNKKTPFFYVSSLSVFPGNGGTVKDDASSYELPLSVLSQLGEGYAQTKVVAERLVAEAGKRGIPVKIFRPGRIVGHSTILGSTSVEDVFCRIIKG